MKLIKLKDEFILVSDEGIKKGDYRIMVDKTSQFYGQFEKHLGAHDCNDQWGKLIAGIPELPSIDFSLLKEEDCKRIGWVDVEKLLKEAYKKHSVHEDKLSLDEQIQRSGGFNVGFKEGFQSAQSLNDKQFSLEDMIHAFKQGTHWKEKYLTETDTIQQPDVSKFIQSLQQTSWEVEVETFKEGGFHDEPVVKPKITNNSIKVLKIK